LVKFVFGLLTTLATQCAWELKGGVRKVGLNGEKIFSIFTVENGNAYVIKAKGTTYMEPLQIESADTSAVFKLDAVNKYLRKLNILQDSPIFKGNNSGAAREKYTIMVKVYDTNYWYEFFFDIYPRVMDQLPKEYSTFNVSENPFSRWTTAL
jgi:hypothetical protein